MKVRSDFDMLYAAREFGSGLEGYAIQYYLKLKVFEEEILNKIAVSEASVEPLVSRHKQIHWQHITYQNLNELSLAEAIFQSIRSQYFQSFHLSCL